MKGLLIFLIIIFAAIAIGAVFFWYKRNSNLINMATNTGSLVTGLFGYFSKTKKHSA